MKSKYEIFPRAVITKKPPKQEISEKEFRRRLKNIDQWRKERLAEFRSKNSR